MVIVGVNGNCWSNKCNTRKNPLFQIKKSILRGCIFLLSSFEGNAKSIWEKLTFMKHDASLDLKWLFSNLELRGMIEPKAYQRVNTLLRSIVSVFHLSTGFVQNASLTFMPI